MKSVNTQPKHRITKVKIAYFRRASTGVSFKFLARIDGNLQVRIGRYNLFLRRQSMRCPDDIPDLKQEPVSV